MDLFRWGIPVEMTSVSLDRISGGGRDGALYTERVYWGVTFRAGLHLPEDLEDDEKTLWEDLLASLDAEGIELGHGSAKGFGWFVLVQPEKETRA